MASISTKASVLAIKPESTEGTPVAPTGATDYVALQPDFTMEPNLDVLENAELRSSIGAAKPILGAENPTASLSHYLRASGTAGTAPEIDDLLLAAFGSKVTNGTERATTSGSTTAILNAASGVGGDFLRGTGMLIKDATNGYRIRVSHARSTDAITLSFEVPSAPASGVNLGKCVVYKPADSGHQTLSVWHYLGNGGGVQLMAGARVTEVSLEAGAGELVNLGFSLEGSGYYFNPIEITSSTRYLDFTDDDGTFACAVTAGWYKDPHELAEALQTAMNTANSGETHTVTYSNTTGRFTIKSTGTVLTLKWNTGTNTANTIATKVGFSAAADSSGTAATTGYTSASAMSLASPYTPTLDSTDPLAAKYHEVMIGDAADYSCFGASNVSVTLTNERAVQGSICAQSGISGSIITGRRVTVNVTALLSQYDADKFARYRAGTDTRFQYSFGPKVGGNWTAGKCGYVYIPTATISSLNVSDQDGLAILEMELTAFVNSSAEGEVYMGFL